MNAYTIRRVAGRYLRAASKKLRVYDFDDTLVSSKSSVSIKEADGKTHKVDSATFAHYSGVEGDEIDFGDFNDVNEPRIIKENFDRLKKSVDAGERVVILTARPKGAASAAKKFMKEQGIDLDVVALASSDPFDKARWIDKAIEDGGYDDVAFYDDSSANAAAVAQHGEAQKKKGVKFESVNTPHPKEADYDGEVIKKTFKSDDPTVAQIKAKPKPAKPEEKGPSSGKSEWWDSQTEKFQKNYCREHERSDYC